MLQPRIYLSLRSLADDIMISEGMTREIDARRERTTLLSNSSPRRHRSNSRTPSKTNKEQFDETF